MSDRDILSSMARRMSGIWQDPTDAEAWVLTSLVNAGYLTAIPKAVVRNQRIVGTLYQQTSKCGSDDLAAKLMDHIGVRQESLKALREDWEQEDDDGTSEATIRKQIKLQEILGRMQELQAVTVFAASNTNS